MRYESIIMTKMMDYIRTKAMATMNGGILMHGLIMDIHVC